MAEIIQSLSICCPAKQCINHCKTCTARQHTNPYEDKFAGCRSGCFDYWEDVIKRMEYAQRKGCETVMLTGSNEPQQNRRWLESLYLAMRSLPKPFLNIEMQTTGALIDMDYLMFLKKIGVTTLAISTFNIFNDETNREIEECADENLEIEDLCDLAYKFGFNIRICVNVTDYVFSDENISDANIASIEADKILNRCAELHANQVTFRKMWSNPGTPEADWIEEHCKKGEILLDAVKQTVKEKGTLINILPYGAARYDYKGFSIVIDTDSMAKDTNNAATKYYIIRENGKMYSSWDSPASIVF